MKIPTISRMVMLVALSIVTVPVAHAEIVTYTLENVILEEASSQMFGTFSWTYDVGDFENGVGEFSYLDIPCSTGPRMAFDLRCERPSGRNDSG